MNRMLSNDHYNFIVFDEGYLAAFNLMSLDKFVVKLSQITNITRSHNNYVAFNFQNISRAAKALGERFNLWAHKPNKDYAFLFARSNVFTTKDPWGLENLLKENNEAKQSHAVRTCCGD